MSSGFQWYQCPECFHQECFDEDIEIPDDCPECGLEGVPWEPMDLSGGDDDE